jgi:hypothetical protein
MFTYKILEEEKLRKNAISKYTDKMGITITSCNNFYSINEIKRKGTSYEVTLYETIKYNWQNIKGFYNLSSGLYVQHKILFEYIENADAWVILSDKYDESYKWGYSTYEPKTKEINSNLPVKI